MVSARAFANQFLPYNSLRIKFIDKKAVQVGIAAYILSRMTPFLLVWLVWGSGRGIGGGGHFGLKAQNLHVTVRDLFLRLLVQPFFS